MRENATPGNPYDQLLAELRPKRSLPYVVVVSVLIHLIGAVAIYFIYSYLTTPPDAKAISVKFINDAPAGLGTRTPDNAEVMPAVKPEDIVPPAPEPPKEQPVVEPPPPPPPPPPKEDPAKIAEEKRQADEKAAREKKAEQELIAKKETERKKRIEEERKKKEEEERAAEEKKKAEERKKKEELAKKKEEEERKRREEAIRNLKDIDPIEELEAIDPPMERFDVAQAPQRTPVKEIVKGPEHIPVSTQGSSALQDSNPELAGWANLVQRQVHRNWNIPEGVPLDGDIYADISFTVDKSGRLIGAPQIVFDPTGGVLGQSGVQAVIAAQPLPALPEFYASPQETVLYRFRLM